MMLIRLARLMGMRELERRPPAEVRSLFLLLLMAAALTADGMLLAPNIKLVMAEFNVSAAKVGLISSAFVISGAIVALLFGYFTDRFSRKTLVIIAVIGGEIPCLLTGYVQTYDQLLVVRALTGLGVGGLIPAIYSLISDLVTEKERCTAVAWIGLIEGVGYLAATWLAGNLGESSFTFLGSSGWRLPFVLLALPNFLLVPLFWLYTTEPERGAGEACLLREIEQGRHYLRRIRLSDYLDLFRNRTNLLFFLQSVPGTVGWGVLPYWMITFYAVQKNVSIKAATNISIVVGLGMMLGGFFGGLAGDRIHQRSKAWLPAFCGITTIAGLLLFFGMIHYPLPEFPSSRDLAGPLALGLMAGFFITVTSANVRAIELNVNPPENRGAMMSLFSLTDSIGRGVGPLVGGALIGSVGYLWTMDLATFCWIPTAFIFLFLMSRQYPKDAARLEKIMESRAAEMRTQPECEPCELEPTAIPRHTP